MKLNELVDTSKQETPEGVSQELVAFSQRLAKIDMGTYTDPQLPPEEEFIEVQ